MSMPLGPVYMEVGTPGRWGNPPSRGRKIKRVYMQSYNPRVLGWGFLRLLLRLQLRSLSRGVLSSHLENDERLILEHICIYSWKRHALCYAVFGFARKRNSLGKQIRSIYNAKYSEMWTLFVCPLRFLVIFARRRLRNVQSFKTYMSRFWAFCSRRRETNFERWDNLSSKSVISHIFPNKC